MTSRLVGQNIIRSFLKHLLKRAYATPWRTFVLISFVSKSVDMHRKAYVVPLIFQLYLCETRLQWNITAAHL